MALNAIWTCITSVLLTVYAVAIAVGIKKVIGPYLKKGLLTDIGTEDNYCALYEMAKDLPLLPLHTPPLDKPSTAGFR